MKPLLHLLCSLVACGFVGGGLVAQAEPPSEEQKGLVGEAIESWIADFERGRLGPRGTLQRGAGLQPDYVGFARRADLIARGDEERLTHMDMLGKMLAFAEQHPSAALGNAVLAVASAGIEKAFLDHRALEVREAGHWALMRMDHQGVWFLLMRASAGERVLVFADHRPTVEDRGSEGLAVGPARRVAALRLLGMKNRPVFRSTIEACLHDADARVRLAATEALDFQRRAECLPKVLDRIQPERHPVVSQALARLVIKLVQKDDDGPDSLSRQVAVKVALRQFGLSGWRTDMDLLELVEMFPHKEIIPQLIGALERAAAPPDKLVATVNARASLQLRERAGGLLKAMTGALIPLDDVAAWRQFWRVEQDRIVVPTKLSTDRSGGTRAQFFGVPVTGSSIAFLIDTSGSMDDAIAGTSAGGSRGSVTSRIDAAKEQIVIAVQAMDPVSRYQLMTFSGEARIWTKEPVKPAANSTRSLTELLSRLRAHGGTNLFDGLVKALQLDQIGYGQQHETKIDELFVLSDGMPTSGEVQNTDEMLRLVREANKYAKVRIHCVFTGSGDGADLLRRLAAENDGVFVQR